MKKVLITGGAGFIGSHTADALLSLGHGVRVLDNLDPQVHGVARKRPAYLDSRVELIVGDIRNREDVARAVDGIDIIYHFASLTGVGQSMYEIESYCDVNVGGMAMLLDVLAESAPSVQKVILSSSRAVYGEGKYECSQCGIVFPKTRDKDKLKKHKWAIDCGVCGEELRPLATDESKPKAPISYYALTKKFQEELLEMFAETYKVPCVVLRYFNVYGVRQAINNPYVGIGAIFTNRVLSGKHIPIYEDGLPGRDFVNVSDVVQANLLAMDNENANNQVFNVGSGELLSVMDLAQMIKQKLDSNVDLLLTNQFRVGDIRHCYADLTRSNSVLGYEPKIKFEDGVEELIKWAKGEPLDDALERAADELKARGLM